MDIDGDGGRPEFGLRGQRRGTESDKGTAANSLSGYHARGLKKIVACLRPGSRNNEARCKTPLRALESQRARSSPLSRQCPNRPSDEGQAASASTASDPLVEFLSCHAEGWIHLKFRIALEGSS